LRLGRLPSSAVTGVSILARAEARALREVHSHPWRCQRVSILARAEARALLGPACRYRFAVSFQSSRAPRRARCALGLRGYFRE